jgi:hypothetical protein
MATSVALTAAGYVVVAGASAGDIDFGGGPLGGAGAAGTLLVELDPLGNVVAAKAYGGQSYGTLVSVAIGPDGSIGVCGAYQGQIDLGSGALPAAQGTFDAYVARLDTSFNPVFVKHLGGDGVDLAQGVAVGPKGAVAVVGAFAGTGDFGGGAVTSLGKADAFAAELDGAGTVRWTKHFGSPDDDDGRGVAFDALGDVFLGGGFSDSVDFGTGPQKSNGAVDAYVVKMNAGGTLAWAKTFGGAGTDETVSIGADSTGNALVGGLFEQQMMVGVTPFVSAGDRDIFALELGPDGSNVWS